MTGEDPWRAFLRDNHSLVRQQRLQTLAFLQGEALSAVALHLGEKIPGNREPDLDAWTSVDFPDPINLAAKFPPRTSATVVADIDADLRPLDGVWTAERLVQARLVLERIFGLMLAVGGIECRHLWGRESLGRWGHLYLPVAVQNKDGLAKLLSLTMRKPVVVGDFKLRIEVRCGPDAKTPLKKPFTLPGSVYRHPAHGDRFDLIGWQFQPPSLPAEGFPRRPPEALQNLVRGLWAAILCAVLGPHWSEGARHDTALLAAGVLARETVDDDALLDAEQARETMLRMCSAFHDPETADRLKLLDNSMARLEAGGQVTGYTKLGELIGDDGKAALIRLRGGGDPDAFDALLSQIAYVPLACGRTDVYLDFSGGYHGAVICERQALINHFYPHPHYPDVRPLKGAPIPLISLALKSQRLTRYASALNLPGIPFGTVMVRDRDDYREASEDEKLDINLPRHINIGPGFATPVPVEPEERAWVHWYGLWQRHLLHLTNNNADAMLRIDQAVAWAVQHPLEKIPLGICFTGDGGIGKSALFNVILKEILGPVIGFTNVLGLEGQFRLDDLEGKLFYVVEEVNLNAAPLPLKELLKDLMKNPRFDINRKYGAKGTIDNRAIPIFLTNERNPNIIIAGQPERSLVLVQGATRENQGMTVEQWRTYRAKIGRDVAEFAAALRDPAVREAAMYYFKVHTEVERTVFDDNSVLGAVADPREELDHLDEALCQIFEANELHPRLRGDFPLTMPFKTEWLLAGVQHHLKERSVSRRHVTPHAVIKRLRSLLDGAVATAAFKDPQGKKREINYITVKYGDMITKASEKLGVTLRPAHELEAEDFGPNTVKPEDCRRAWDATFVNNNGY